MDSKPSTTRLLTRSLWSPVLPVLVFLLFLVVAGLLKHGIEQEEKSQLDSSIEAEATTLARELQQDFNAHTLALRRMAARRMAQPDLPEAIWRADARRYLEHFGTYQAVEWIDSDFIIRWAEPMAGNQEVIGYNVAFSDSRRRALQTSALTGAMDVSGVITLKQGGTGLVIYEPIGQAEANMGFIAGVFHMEQLLESLNIPRVRKNFHIDVLDKVGPIYQLEAQKPAEKEFRQSVALPLPEINWTLQLTPTTGWIERQQSLWPVFTFLTIALMGLLVSLAILLVQLVMKRNQVLTRTQNDLQQEIYTREAVQQDLVRIESTDALTGLANRRFFMEDLAHTLTMADRQLRQVALIMIDLERFQTLNDSLGHQFGDELLVAVSQRLDSLSDERVLVAYSGGDEFMICQQQVEALDDVIGLLGQLQQCFGQPFMVQGQEYSITATMGVAVFPQSGLDADLLLRNADIALYRAKENGRNSYQFYTEGMQDREVMRLELDNDISVALAKDEFVLFFQPQLDLATMQVGSVEALIRWQHPVRGLIPPMDFIPLAEESGRITDIGRWVVLAACRQLAEWREGPLAHLRIAVNLSGRELDDDHLVDHIQQALERFGVPPDRLEVELTEEIFIDNLERNLNQLTRLNKLGIHLAIDDFGVGYSSLAYLRDFPVDLLKIDRSFITRVTERHDDAVITRAVINLAHNLGIQVAAEGIETEAQLNFLKNHRCDLAQGYLISRPIPADELHALLVRGIIFDDLTSLK
ncbi:putative bifunctional diguanylate cyclase/phosphodiesterase [Marinobacter salicampi]|uniref:putative bifunctional diguanylate cyclase/phosphodiesterase n=1 Tax=Marinobacter salicampi TaxID=435907 RepID=UPI001F5E7EB7|nr:EAL domain-containing protein [Marinobacter salicampi]